ncbi:MAG: FAD-binding oxidoreductase [Pseudomonadota bacterium]|nr:FAD-binding oxidoreductase [Pseudomonadota bacterium]
MLECEVQVHGAGWAGLAIAKGLVDAGVHVRLVDPAGPLGGASGRALGLALPTHPEHPHRLESGLGTTAAAALVAFIRAGLDVLPGLARVGVDWRASAQEEGELPLALAAAARIGLGATRTAEGYHLHDGGVVDLVALHAALVGPPVHPVAVTAELDVYATGAVALDPFLADKITPVRWQSVRFDGPALAVPMVSQHATVFWTGGRGGGLVAAGARWATPHMEIGEAVPEPEPRVTAMLERLTRQGFPDAGAVTGVQAGIVGESCDGLPIVGPVPGRPRAIVCTGFGIAGLAYALPCARAVVDGILGRPTTGVPAPLRVTRFA